MTQERPVNSPSGADRNATSGSDLAEGARQVAAYPDAREALDSVVDLAMVSCGCAGASVTLVGTAGGAETTSSSSDLIERADGLQYAFDEGPCLRAAERGGVYVITDTAADPRWPTWGPAVAALGLRSVISVHLFTDVQVLGALNLYYPRDSINDELVETARIVAAHASVALARVQSERDLWRAVDARHLIGQAQGILMERLSLSSEKAFSVLRRYSQDYNIKLRDVASELVRTGRLPDAAPR